MVGVVFFHKNLRNRYKWEWVKKCVNSILNQDFQDFKIYEIDYGGDNFSCIDEISPGRDFFFYSEFFSNHADAMNFIISKAFESGCDFVFNTNIDDYYSLDRLSKQLVFLQEGYDVVSSNFFYIQEIDGEDTRILELDVEKKGDIKENIKAQNNVIAHPCVAYSKKFWEGNKYFPHEIPLEDLFLWERSIDSGYRFFICKDFLLNYRIHSNQITSSKNRSEIIY